MPLTALTRRASLLGAFTALAGPVLAARSDIAPVTSVQQLADGLLQIMKAGQATPFTTRFDILAPLIDLIFDLDTILRTSVGSAWASLSPSEQDPLRPAFRRYTIASYVNSFDHFNGQRFYVEPQTQSLGADEQVVHTRIIPPSGDGHQIDYVMRKYWQRLARGGRAGGRDDQPGRGPAIGFSSATLARRCGGAGGELVHQVSELVRWDELSGLALMSARQQGWLG
jgi:phospholipid transport system substrate-binding protein